MNETTRQTKACGVSWIRTGCSGALTSRAGTVVDAVQWISRRMGPHGALILILAAGAAITAGLTSTFANVYESVAAAHGVAGLDHPVLAAGDANQRPSGVLLVHKRAHMHLRKAV
ncbi:hypothetical protein ACVWY0_003804 [Arthrobacter sp. UYNi723]